MRLSWDEVIELLGYSPPPSFRPPIDRVVAAQIVNQMSYNWREKVERAEHLFLMTLEPDQFLSLIWQEHDGIRVLADGGPRTLGDIARRMQAKGLTFERLTTDLGYSRTDHDPRMFDSFLPIHAEFDREKVGFIGVVPAIPDELSQSPGGSFHIDDGVHRSLVWAYRMVVAGTEGHPARAVLMIPRPA